MTVSWEEGTSKLVLTIDDIPWELNAGAEATLAAMNKAFAIHYRATQISLRTPGTKMFASVQDSLTDGSGSTVADDLQEAFRYLSRRWQLKHSTTEFWWGDMYRKTYRGHQFDHPVQVPKSIYEYVKSVDSKMVKVAKAYNHWGDQFWVAEEHKENEDWEKLGRTIKTVSSTAGHVKHLMWLAPPEVNNRFGKASSFVSTASSLHGAATALADGNLTDWAQMKFATEVLGKLPILGQFYGAALETIPGLVKGYTALVKCRADMIYNASEGRDFRLACREENKWHRGHEQ